MEDRAKMKNLKVEIEDYPKDDCMKTGRIIILDFFENKLMRFLISFYLIINIILLIIQSYIFLSTFESSRFIMHGPVYFGTSSLVVSFVTTLKVTPCVKKWLTIIKLWKINIDGKFHRHIMAESKFITTYFAVITILGLLSGFLFMFLTEKEKQIFFAYDIFKQFSPTWESILSWIYTLSFILNGLVMPASCNQLIYVTSHLRYQIYIVLHHLQNMNRNCDATTELHLPYDENYQKEIKYKLTLLGKRAHHITGIGLSIMDQVRFYVVLFYFSGLALAISILILLVKLQDDVQMNYLRIFTFIITVCLTGAAVLIAGQKIEDMNEEAHNVLFTLNWYTWNKKNKQIYLMILLSQSNSFKMDITDTISINFYLGLRLARALYSVLSVLRPSK